MVKKPREDFIYHIDEDLDFAYFGYPAKDFTMNIHLDKDVMIHVDKETKKVIAVTIINFESFCKQVRDLKVRLEKEVETKLFLDKKAKEVVKDVHEYIRKSYQDTSLPVSLDSPNAFLDW